MVDFLKYFGGIFIPILGVFHGSNLTNAHIFQMGGDFNHHLAKVSSSKKKVSKADGSQKVIETHTKRNEESSLRDVAGVASS